MWKPDYQTTRLPARVRIRNKKYELVKLTWFNGSMVSSTAQAKKGRKSNQIWVVEDVTKQSNPANCLG